MIIRTAKQPTGNTCGPTCLYMAYNALYGEEHTIMEIAELCTTDWVVGTPPDKMKLGMDSIGLSYKHHITTNNPFTHLKQVLEKQNIPIIRTITDGIPHWIIVNGYSNKNIWSVKCPFKGDLIYDTEELDLVWGLRNYEFFEIINDENRERD